MAVNKNKDSAGDSKSQITIFTNRIKYLTNHLKENRKDHSARRGLVDLVSKRKKMLNMKRHKKHSGPHLNQ